MGRSPCCDKAKVKRGPWSPEEDSILRNHIQNHGTGGNWISFPHKAGLKRCGKSCRLRWLNYLRPDIKLGGFTEEEDGIIASLYANMGSRWSVIASHLQGRTDNDVKNHWNTKLKKKKELIASSSQENQQITQFSSINSIMQFSSPMFLPKQAAEVDKNQLIVVDHNDHIVDYYTTDDHDVVHQQQQPMISSSYSCGFNGDYASSSSQENQAAGGLSSSPSALLMENEYVTWCDINGGGASRDSINGDDFFTGFDFRQV